MKKEITAYITAMINNYEMTIERINKGNTANSDKITYECIAGRLQDLIDFIDDIPEEGQANAQEEIERLTSEVSKLKRQNLLLNKLIDLMVNEKGVIECVGYTECCKS